MSKKLLSMIIAIAFVFGCMSSGLSEIKGNERWFIPSEFAYAFNEGLSDYVYQIYYTDVGDMFGVVYRSLSLTFSEIDNGIIYYNNETWGMELSGYYEDRNLDDTVPAHSITFSVEEAYEAKALAAIELALCQALCSLDGSSDEDDFNTYGDLIMNGWKEGYRAMEVGDYVLLAAHYQPRYMFSILHNNS